MASKLFKLLVALATSAVVVVAVDVPITIYYESLCPDSQKFFKEQFNPIYNSSFKKYINAAFVPCGHTNITGDALMCQHGTVECDGNRLQACALNKMNTTEIKATYIGCLMALNISKNISTYPFDQCKNDAGIFYNDIIVCYNDTAFSTDLLKKYKNQTDTTFKNKEKFNVPYIALNNTIDDDVSASATQNFKTFLCNNLKSENLEECKGNSASKFSATLIPATILFLLGRL